MIETLLEKAGLKPVQKSNYILLTCPACGKHEAFVYPTAGYLSWIICNRKNKCAYRAQIKDIITPISQGENQGNINVIRSLFKDHGLEMEWFIPWLLGEPGKEDFPCISLSFYHRKTLKFNDKKYIWKLSKGFTAKYGEFMPILNVKPFLNQSQKINTLYIFAGEWDWMRGLADGLSCTTSLFGENYIPKYTTDIFIPFTSIVIVYDNDTVGIKYSGKLGEFLSEKFPQKKVQIVKLPFGEGEKGKDYCDWRQSHSLEEFLALEAVPVKIKKTAAEKAAERFEKKRRKAEGKEKPFAEIKGKIKGGEVSYLVTDTGVWKEETHVHGGQIYTDYIKVCADDIEIVTHLTDIWAEEAYVKIRWGENQKIIPQAWLLNKNVEKLTTFGIRCLSANTKKMGEYFLASLDSSSLLQKKFTTRNGWLKNEFVCGSKMISSNFEMLLEQKEEALDLGKKGEKELWVSTIKKFVENDPQAQIVLGAAAASPLLKRLFVEPGTIHLYQDSSMGKSFLAQLAASLWGKPHGEKGIVKNWYGTIVGHETYFHTMNHLPSFLDESQLAKTKEILISTVYNYANGQGKSRGNINVEMAKFLTWHGFLISTGEDKLTSQSNFGGLSARVIEILRNPIEKVSETSFRRAKKIISENYGFGDEIIKYYLRNQQNIEDVFFQQLEELEKINLSNNIQKRMLPRWAAIILGCQILKQLFAIEYSYEDICKEMFQSLSETEEKGSTSFYEWVKDIYFQNKAHFNEKNKMGEYKETAETPEIWGHYDVKRQAICFFSDKLKELMDRASYAWSQISILKKRGLLLCNHGNKFQVRIGTRKYKMVAFFVPPDLEE